MVSTQDDAVTFLSVMDLDTSTIAVDKDFELQAKKKERSAKVPIMKRVLRFSAVCDGRMAKASRWFLTLGGDMAKSNGCQVCVSNG